MYVSSRQCKDKYLSDTGITLAMMCADAPGSRLKPERLRLGPLQADLSLMVLLAGLAKCRWELSGKRLGVGSGRDRRGHGLEACLLLRVNGPRCLLR